MQMKTNKRYFHTSDGSVWYMISISQMGHFYVYSGANQLELAFGRGIFERRFPRLYEAKNFINNQIQILEK